MSEHAQLDDLGFPAHYSVEVSPEFPGDGDWRCPTYGFGRGGGHTSFLEAGDHVVLRVRCTDGVEWVGSFGSGFLQFGGTFASPSGESMIVVANGDAYLVDTRNPQRGAIALSGQATQLIGVPSAGLVLLVDFIAITAISANGIEWTSARLCWDDLRVMAVTESEIVCSGEFMPAAEFVIDLQTGRHLRGPLFVD